MLYQLSSLNIKQILTGDIQCELPRIAACRSRFIVRSFYDGGETRGKVAETSARRAVRRIATRHANHSTPLRAAVADGEIPARTCAFYAIGMAGRGHSANGPSARIATRHSTRCMRRRERATHAHCRPASMPRRIANSSAAASVVRACANAVRRGRMRRIVRGLLDPLRRRRRDARRRRVMGIRRSAGRELEPRRAAAGDSRVARGNASRASAAHRSRRDGAADSEQPTVPRRDASEPDRIADRG